VEVRVSSTSPSSPIVEWWSALRWTPAVGGVPPRVKRGQRAAQLVDLGQQRSC
jgi:hypothetical protein